MNGEKQVINQMWYVHQTLSSSSYVVRFSLKMVSMWLGFKKIQICFATKQGKNMDHQLDK